jgi:hypothetical protein
MNLKKHTKLIKPYRKKSIYSMIPFKSSSRIGKKKKAITSRWGRLERDIKEPFWDDGNI